MVERGHAPLCCLPEAGYSKRNIAETLDALRMAGILEVLPVSNQLRYRLAKATDRAYQRLVQRVTIPGFRKGKAPRKILERAVGVDALYREALDFVMPDAYREAVKETGIALTGRATWGRADA